MDKTLLPRKRKGRKLPVVLTPDEALRLVSAASCRRDRVLLLVLLYLGVRVAELCALCIERVDLAGGQVLVYQGKGGKDRMLPIAARLVEPLREWIGTQTEGWLFPSPRKADHPLTTRTVQLVVSRTARVAGITRPDPSQKITPHKLRHSFCTRLFERGVDVVSIRDLMGHGNIATTNTYAHATASRLKAAVDRL